MHKLYNVIMMLLDFNRIQILSVAVYYRHATNVRILSSMLVLMLDILKEKNQNLKTIEFSFVNMIGGGGGGGDYKGQNSPIEIG